MGKNRVEENVKSKSTQIVENIIKCNNSRCVTSTEKYAPQIFSLVDEGKREYKCQFCDNIHVLAEVK